VDFEFPQDASNPELTAILGGDFDLLLSPIFAAPELHMFHKKSGF
jgi:hypothetical protein